MLIHGSYGLFKVDLIDFKVKIVLKKERHMKDINIEAVEKLIEFSSRDKSQRGLRTYALLTTLQSTGARITEVLSIERKNVVFKGGIKDFVYVTGKGEKRRRLLINETARDAIFEYINTHGSIWVFNGVTGSERPMSRRNAHIILKDVAEASGLLNFHPHLMRHYFVKKMANLGVDYRDIQKMAGHSNPSATGHYGGGVTKTLKKEKNSLSHMIKFSELVGAPHLS